MALTDKLKAIADAVRAKTGGTALLTLDQMAAAIAGITAGGGTVETGSFVSDGNSKLIIPCAFEPDVILISRDAELNTGGDVKGIFSFTVIKNWHVTGRYIANDGSTSIMDGSRYWGIEGYGPIDLSYADGNLSLNMYVNGRQPIAGYTYNYTLGRCGL